MTEDRDGTTQGDVRQYIDHRLDEAGIDIEENPDEARELIDDALVKYFLYSDSDAVQPYEYHYFTIIRIDYLLGEAQDIYMNEIEDTIQDLEKDSDLDEDTIDEIAKQHGRYTIGNSITLAYSMAYEMVQDLLEELLPAVLRDDLEDGTGAVMLSQLESFDAKLQILQASGILDDETASALWHIHRVRGDLVHDIEKRYTLDNFDDLTEIDQTHQAVYDLYEAVYGIHVHEHLKDRIGNGS